MTSTSTPPTTMPRTETAPRRTWRPFVVLETTAILSGTANGITMVAFPWLVLETTGDASLTAVVAAATALPLLVSMLFAGTIVDMVGRRAVSVVADLLSLTSVALVPILAVTVGLDFGVLLAVAALGAVFDPAGLTARETMLPEAARRAGLPLARANGIHESAYGFAYLLGPGIGGVLIGVLGTTSTFWVTAAVFGVSALAMATTRMPGGGRPAKAHRPQGLWTSTRDGLRFLWRDRVLRSMAILTSVLVGVWLPIEGVVLPVIFNEIDEPVKLGLLITAMSAGGVVGALGYAALGHRFRRRPAFVASLILTSIPVLGMAFLPSYGVMLALSVLTGVFFGAINPITNLAMQNRTPEAMRGRVVGVMGSAAYAAGPLGYLVAGPLVEAWGPQPVFILMTSLLLLASLSTLFMPVLKHLDDAPVPGSAGAPHVDGPELNPDLRHVEAERIAAMATGRAA